MEKSLLAIVILLPFILGGVALAVRDNRARIPIIFINSAALVAASLLLLGRKLPIELALGSHWNLAVIILDYVLLAYFWYVAVRYGNALIGVFTALQIGGLIYLDAKMHPHVAEPALYVDHLSLIMCLIICIIGSLIVIYAIRYMQHHEEHLHLERTRQHRFFFWMIIFLGAMNGLVFANDLFWLYFFWEITTLCCYELIRHDRTPEAQHNAERALWMCSLGGFAFVVAILRSFAILHTLSLQELIATRPLEPALLLPVAFLCLAGFTKAAQAPFQSWLLGAMIAPTPVSALLHSSTMVKAGVYLLLRIAPAFEGTALSIAVAVFGALVFMVTSILAISQTESKRVLAYSTIGNLGLIIFCAGINTPFGIAAGILLLVFHAISKGLLFLCAGVIEHDIRSRNIEDMEGLAARYPMITFITVAGMLSMLIAPWGVLISKWAGMEAAAELPTGWAVLILVLLAVGSGATTVFWSKWMGRLLFHPPSPAPSSPKEKFDGLYFIPLILLLLGATIFSIMIGPFYEKLVFPAVAAYYPGVHLKTSFWNIARGTTGFFLTWPLFIIVALALVLPRSRRWAPEKVRAAYMCGEQVEDVRACEFRSVADEPTPLRTGGFYLERALGERNLNMAVNMAASALLLVIFALAVL